MQAGVICVLQLASEDGTGVVSSTRTRRGDFTAHGDPRLAFTVRLITGVSLMPGVI